MIERNHSFEAIAAYKPWNPTITGTGQAERFTAQRVSASYFDVLGTAPFVHQNFLADDATVLIEPRGPVVIAQHYHRMPLVDSIVFFGIEHTARCGFDAEHAEEIAGNHFRIHAFGLVIHAERSADEAAAEHFGKWIDPLPIILNYRV